MIYLNIGNTILTIMNKIFHYIGPISSSYVFLDMKLSLLSPFPLGLITKILFFVIAAITSEAVDDVHYSNCSKPHSCGSITEIKYPFWGGDRPSFCGLQDYEIMCRDMTRPVFSMSSQLFSVLSIKRSPYNYTMIIARADLPDNICHSDFVDTTINFNLVSSSAKNLTLFYSCLSDFYLDILKPEEKFKCGDNDSVIAPLEETVSNEVSQWCKEKTISVMLENWEKFSQGKLGLKELMKEGFEVEYTTQEKMQKCQSCEKSGGVCGSNTSTNEFTCFCKDGPCPGKSHLIRSIGIGAFIIGLGALLSLIVVWCFSKTVKKEISKRRKEKFIKENGGMLLQQQLSSGHGSVEKTKLFKSYELEKATNFYNVDRVLGQGGQGTVYKGVLPDGRLVAVKKSKIAGKLNIGHFINEIVILSQINHRNVVNLLGCCLETKVPLLVYELISNGTLFQHIHNPTKEFPLNWGVRLQIAVETAQALSYLHSAASRPIYHRDIKSTNILLDDNYNAKVSDFGISRLVDVGNTHLTTHVKGTFGYLDPEYFQSHQFNEKSDVYSFGVVLVELLTGQKPIISGPYQEAKGLASHFLESMDDNRLFEIIDPQLSKEDSKIEEMVEVAHLAKACLNSKGKKRPTMKKVANQLEGIRTSREQSIPRENDENIAEEVYDDSSSSTGAWGENSPSLNVDIDSLLNS